MKNCIVLCLFFAGLGIGSLNAQTPTPPKAPTGIAKMDPAMDDLIDTNAQVEPVIKDFFYFTEGIVWVPQGKDSGYWLFAEMAANKILKLTMDGKLDLYMDKCGYKGWDTWRHGFTQTNGKPPSDPDYKRFNLPGCNGLARDNQGRLIVATWGGRGLDRIEKNGQSVTLTDSVDGQKFNSTNDGVFMWKNGKTTTVAKVDGANGLALSPDEQYLYANGNRMVKKFKVQPDDSVDTASMEVIMDKTKDPLPGITDGMKVDSKGNIWESCCGGIVVLTPEGKQLGIVYTPEAVANLNFGDPDYKSLYIVARTSIYKIRTKVSGIPGR